MPSSSSGSNYVYGSNGYGTGTGYSGSYAGNAAGYVSPAAVFFIINKINSMYKVCRCEIFVISYHLNRKVQ